MKKKIIAELKRWDGKVEKKKIKKSWIEDIVFAVEGQFTIQNNDTDLKIKGSDYYHVDIYEVGEWEILSFLLVIMQQ